MKFKQLNVSQVPDDVYRELKVAAARRDLSLSEFVRRICREAVELPDKEYGIERGDGHSA